MTQLKIEGIERLKGWMIEVLKLRFVKLHCGNFNKGPF